MVLGLYYLTRERINAKGEGMIFADVDEVHRAYENGAVDLHAKIKVRIKEIQLDEDGECNRNGKTLVETTVGRALLSKFYLRVCRLI